MIALQHVRSDNCFGNPVHPRLTAWTGLNPKKIDLHRSTAVENLRLESAIQRSIQVERASDES